MRQQYLALLSVFASLPAMALTFQTRLENIEWKVEGDQFECRLTQPITDFGSGEFVRRAGEQATFRLKAYNGSLGAGSATLLAAAAPWQPGRGDINLGAVRAGSGDVLFNSSQAQAGRLFNGLLEGRSPTVRHYGREGGYSEIRLLPVKFNKAYNDYQLCTTKLLPMNYDHWVSPDVGVTIEVKGPLPSLPCISDSPVTRSRFVKTDHHTLKKPFVSEGAAPANTLRFYFDNHSR